MNRILKVVWVPLANFLLNLGMAFVVKTLDTNKDGTICKKERDAFIQKIIDYIDNKMLKK